MWPHVIGQKKRKCEGACTRSLTQFFFAVTLTLLSVSLSLTQSETFSSFLT
ncbi:hypothetical protein ACE6H2_010040 [Prunus campanulata]